METPQGVSARPRHPRASQRGRDTLGVSRRQFPKLFKGNSLEGANEQSSQIRGCIPFDMVGSGNSLVLELTSIGDSAHSQSLFLHQRKIPGYGLLAISLMVSERLVSESSELGPEAFLLSITLIVTPGYSVAREFFLYDRRCWLGKATFVGISRSH
uniref:Uncharacterized protein n=1 Tax=Asparagus officinalis TaxID=4686 RepID=Q2XNS8_ASPOF|nr:hypothetical protein 9.t00007 [Asparagus officinalis]